MRFITIIDTDLDLVLKYCKWAEETFAIDQLTGINFTQTNDKKYVLGLSFEDEKAWEKAMSEGKLFSFEIIRDIEEDWLSYQTISKFLILGSFTYKFFKGDTQ